MKTISCDIHQSLLRSSEFDEYCVRFDEPNIYGHIIKKDSFAQSNGKKVPLHIYNKGGVYNWDTCIGGAYLEIKNDGVYAHCSLNDAIKAIFAKDVLLNANVKYKLSFGAERIKLQNNIIIEGDIVDIILKFEEE